MNKDIFFDVDGVVADFAEGVREAFDLPLDWQPDRWDIAEQLGVSWQVFTERICREQQFWSELQYYTDGIAIWRWLQELCHRKFIPLTVATTPFAGDEIRFLAQRQLWIDSFMSDSQGSPPIVYTGPGHKHLLAAPGRLLIDDSPANIEAWEAAGGDTILIPRPWNGDHPPRMNSDRLNIIKEFIVDYAEQN